MRTADDVELPRSLTLVGPGRLGRSLALWLAEVGLEVQLVGRGQAIPAGPLTWLTVPDAAIAEVAEALPQGGLVLHSSGACDLDVLAPHPLRGSLHPLMTFPGPELGLPTRAGMPTAISAVPEALPVCRALCDRLGFRSFEVHGDRAAYHASAVVAGNFATTLLAEASRLLASTGVPLEDAPALLAPLALQSLRNAARHSPRATLTGPVARGDEAVIRAHLEAIERVDIELLPLYRLLLAHTRALVD